MYSTKTLMAVLLLVFLYACKDETTTIVKKQNNESTLFSLISEEHSNIHFKNTVTETKDFNVLKYYYAYNGGGVAVGDVNNDGLQDIYFTSNQKSNKLYINKGDFKFEDVTEQANVSDADGWSTGVNMVDINNDGWMDIYVCKSASLGDEALRSNKLFVNQKDGTFREEAKEWGLDDQGLSVQSYFFDYDKDGDLDMFLVNHRNDFVNSVDLDKVLEDGEFYPQTSNHLYENEGSKFLDVTVDSGLLSKDFSLSAAIGDYNNDGWLDIFVANDFVTPDKMYINNKNGTFSNQIDNRLKHTSYSSMGSDFADINNDFYPDLLVLDMSAADHSRGKQNMATMNTAGFWDAYRLGFHFAYMSNILNLNNGNGSFSDIAQVSGASKTDWSWAPLMADFDNDGHKDIFITNGIKREIANQDFGHQVNIEEEAIERLSSIDSVLNKMPSEKIQNYAFKNNADLSFKTVAEDWGLDQRLNSNGAAYADLDNDGDLDLVLNNLEDVASVYRNNSPNNFISIKLVGGSDNKNAVGSKVKVYTKKTQQYGELFLSRGYQSSVSPVLNFGLGDENTIDRIEVVWYNGKVSIEEHVKANQILTLQESKSSNTKETEQRFPINFKRINPSDLGVAYNHVENDFNDFSKQVLLPQKQSHQGPAFVTADINNDGLEDLFLGGGFNQPAELYVQNASGKFNKMNVDAFMTDKAYEDNGAHFFDANGDGNVDLYVASGGYELSENDNLLQDRLYINDGKGGFVKSNGLPKMLSSTKAVKSLDYDSDGDLDLIVAGRVVPGKYPLAPRSYILENENGQFKDVTEKIAPDFVEVGIVNDFVLSDYDGDNDKDVIVVGEWMPITVFNNDNGLLKKEDILAFKDTEGWWNTIKEIDFDGDGDMDYFVGNLGANNKFHPSKEKPLHIYGNNFDNDGNYDMILSKVYNGNLVPVRGKECSTSQNPFVSQKIKTYKEFANSTLADIYGTEQLANSYHKEVYEFESVYVENKGNGEFEIKHLPVSAQLGPTMAFVFADINKDGYMDVLGMGGIHEAEVETVRYDSNIGYILLGDANSDLKPFKDISFYNDLNTKHMALIQVKNEPYLLAANNNGPLTVFKMRP
ncbi:VCBS repeat-containing protein [Flavobacteriaceae bacterium XHP0103]|uniref:VCBS repeat-containing protein n=1 Tax=Marixanthotalea marina TaxID=2844359 RepID=UPI002989CEBF|nr:VCBS repeat-containing protein [Marixanthotalea marina]MBU3822693.1 VCBS repeat-containing protein [Marixanthotalea marina]